MTTKKILLLIGVIAGSFLTLFNSCTKNSNPKPPVHDTVTVTKHDTTQLTDTLYATKPDPTVNLTKGLLVYLPFSGNIADSSGHNNPTEATGPVLTYDMHGWANNAFGATGTGYRVEVTNNGSINFDTAYTISLDFMVNTNGYHAYLSMIDPATGNAPSFIVGTNTPGINYLDFGTSDYVPNLCDQYGENNPTHSNDTTNFIPQVGAWYNAIWSYHKDTLQVYINGNLINTKVISGTGKSQLCPNSKVVVGGWWDGGPVGINGKLDEVRLYNRVLTPHEITWLARNFQVTSTRAKPGVKTGNKSPFTGH